MTPRDLRAGASMTFALFLAIGRGQTICIDPGHPSEVGRGARGRYVTEIQIAWQIAGALESRLRRDGLSVILTKGRADQFVSNQRRAEIANAAGARLMLRLHCDAGEGSGFAVFYPGRTGTLRGTTGPSGRVRRESEDAARRLHTAMGQALAGTLPDKGLKTDLQTAVGAKQGALTGSIFSKVPVVLVELVVLTNPRDETWIRSKTGFAKMVEALEQGVLKACRPKS